MRKVQTRIPSFPNVPTNAPLRLEDGLTWQVIGGDEEHYRIGRYSPNASSPEEIVELEQHNCPEFFLLLQGRLTLILCGTQGVEEVPLELGQPVFITRPHNGYCPGGPHTGSALVIERDAFDTEYRTVEDWISFFASSKE